MNQNYIEIIGYLGSIFVAISLSLNSVWKMRWINLFGCAMFTIYGYFIKAWPLCIVNAYITIMDAWYIAELTRDTSCFQMDSLENIGDKYFDKFYKFYEDDIRSFFPNIKYETLKSSETYLMFRNMIPVGIFSIKTKDANRAQILMDYIVPKFRDLKFGAYLYEKKSYFFTDKDIKELEVITNVPLHEKYLLKLGFKKVKHQDDKQNIFLKELI